MADKQLIRRSIDVIPTVDAVPVVHAHWERVGTGITERIACSNCKSSCGSWKSPPFCSQCGANVLILMIPVSVMLAWSMNKRR